MTKQQLKLLIELMLATSIMTAGINRAVNTTKAEELIKTLWETVEGSE